MTRRTTTLWIALSLNEGPASECEADVSWYWDKPSAEYRKGCVEIASIKAKGLDLYPLMSAKALAALEMDLRAEVEVTL